MKNLDRRFILEIEAIEVVETSFAKPSYRALFRREGVPEMIRIDNGAPFAWQVPGGLSKLIIQETGMIAQF